MLEEFGPEDEQGREWKVRLLLKGSTQAQMAKEILIHHTKLSKIFNGWLRATPQEAKAIEDYLGAVPEGKAVGEPPDVWNRVIEEVRKGYDEELARLLLLADKEKLKKSRDPEELGRALAQDWFRQHTKEELIAQIRGALDEA